MHLVPTSNLGSSLIMASSAALSVGGSDGRLRLRGLQVVLEED